MTNLDYVRSLNSEELAETIFTIILPVGQTYSESRLGIAKWLDEKFVPMNGMSLNYGCVYSFDNFYSSVKCKCFIDYDGIGYFIDNDGNKVKPVRCNCDWLMNNKPENSNYILWFNR